jgi:hypothetical protein
MSVIDIVLCVGLFVLAIAFLGAIAVMVFYRKEQTK